MIKCQSISECKRGLHNLTDVKAFKPSGLRPTDRRSEAPVLSPFLEPPAPLKRCPPPGQQLPRGLGLSSGMHHGAQANLDDILWKKRSWNDLQAYAESKLHDAMLAFAVARRWPEVLSNALEPDWVPTNMGGPGAPDDMDQAHLTQAWLAAGDDPKAQVTGEYFYHLRRMTPN